MPESDEAASPGLETSTRVFPNPFKRNPQSPKKTIFGGKSLEDSEVESDKRNLFSRAVRIPHLQKSATVSVSPIKVQVSPAEPASASVQVPSAVRITRRHTEQLTVMRKFTPPVQIYSSVILLQPPPVPVVSRFPEPVYGRPRVPDIVEEMDSATGAGLPNLPISYNRTRLPPLQVTSTTLGASNAPSSLSVINNPKPINSVRYVPDLSAPGTVQTVSGIPAFRMPTPPPRYSNAVNHRVPRIGMNNNTGAYYGK
ncbi:hypothetical protein FO519_004593 [Halicephalobus sp. NKZ332]|nr:hypothetical protein FO519_004593 [Halicephalobus sp. NKZ332]